MPLLWVQGLKPQALETHRPGFKSSVYHLWVVWPSAVVLLCFVSSRPPIIAPTSGNHTFPNSNHIVQMGTSRFLLSLLSLHQSDHDCTKYGSNWSMRRTILGGCTGDQEHRSASVVGKALWGRGVLPMREVTHGGNQKGERNRVGAPESLFPGVPSTEWLFCSLK